MPNQSTPEIDALELLAHRLNGHLMVPLGGAIQAVRDTELRARMEGRAEGADWMAREIVEALRERPPGAGTTYGLVADSIERSFLSSGVGSQALSPGGVDRACEHKPGVSRAYLNEEGSDGA